MIFLKTDEEIELLRESNRILGLALAELAKMIAPGVTTLQLDKRAYEFIKDNGGEPGFLNYNGYPNSICTSVNEQVVHGIPSNKVVLKEGDIVSIDGGVYKNGFHADSAYTFCVGEVAPEVLALLRTTKEALYRGIDAALAGKRVGDVGNAVQRHCEAKGLGVVKEFVGHGIGKEMHEDPPVPNYGKKGEGPLIENGLCIAIEPMITLGSPKIGMMPDKWTVKTLDGKYAAHFEHTVAVHHGKADILSSFEEIEKIEGILY